MIVAYCFIGALPKYAVDTVYQMRLFYKGPIYFILSDIQSIYCKQLEEYDVTIINYEDAKHSEFNTCIDTNYTRFDIASNLKGREKIFIYSFERFAVLYQTMVTYNLSNVLFLELDNLIYDDPLKWENAFSLKDMAYMYDKEDRCSSGICFIKNKEILCRFVDFCMYFINTTQKHLNEMTALYEFWKLNKNDIQILPTHWQPSISTIASEHYNKYESIFDSAPMGIYLGGIDPYHTNGIIEKNKYWWANDIDYTGYNYVWKKDECGRNIPYIDTIKINNLHIHSKDLESHVSKINNTHIKNKIQIVCIPELNPLPVMKRVFLEVSGGFKDYNCTIKEVYTISDLEDGGIIFLDDAGGIYINKREIFDVIAQKCPNSIFICWYWRDLSFTPFKKMLYTGQYYLWLHKLKYEIADYNYSIHPLFVPLKLRADDSPSLIGTYERNVVRDYCFMGGGYRMDWIPENYTGIYHRVIWDNYLSYEDRRQIYLSSTFAFGFQAEENIRTGHLSQRIFEGMAYGCIVLCDNPYVSEYTDDIVVYVSSKEDLIEKMNYYKTHPDIIKRKQKEGYEWVKKYGTNRLSCNVFLEKIYDVFGEKFNKTKPIVSVKVMGGLGNQLFQIVSSYAYAKRENGKLQLIRNIDNRNRKLYWDTIFSKLDSSTIVESFTKLDIWYEEFPTIFKEIDPLTSNGIFLNGYMQSSKYFKDIKHELRSLFYPNTSTLRNIYEKYKYIIDNKDSIIVLHSRQTDYLNNAQFHGPLDYSYYEKALDIMIPRVKNPILLVCGDDLSFWKQSKLSTCIYLDDDDVTTFYLLQQCTNFIMSNSTFIWWCVWLSNAKNVIVPAKWFGPDGPSQYEDIYEDEWVRI